MAIIVRIKDVAKRADVSEATVSLSLNGSPLVNAETRKRIEKLAKEMGYVPNPYARKLVLQRSGMIGVAIPDIENVFYASFVHYLNEYSRNTGYTLSILISGNSPQHEEKIIADMMNAQMEGILYVPVNVPNDNPRPLEMLHHSNIPTVCATTCFSDFPCVMSDMESGMTQLVEHMAQNGYQKIAYLSGPQGVYTLDIREQAFRKAIHKFGLNQQEMPYFFMKEVTYQCACEAVETILSHAMDVDAIVCVNDIMALGAINTLQQHQIAIPQQIAVSGYDDSIFSIASPVPITTVHQNIDAIAQKSIALLMQRIQSPEILCSPSPVLIPTQVIIRNSTK